MSRFLRVLSLLFASHGFAADVLLVDDDGNSPDVRSYYTAALDTLGVAHDVWDTSSAPYTEPDAASLSSYKAVLWFTGTMHPILKLAPGSQQSARWGLTWTAAAACSSTACTISMRKPTATARQRHRRYS